MVLIYNREYTSKTESLCSVNHQKTLGARRPAVQLPELMDMNMHNCPLHPGSPFALPFVCMMFLFLFFLAGDRRFKRALQQYCHRL